MSKLVKVISKSDAPLRVGNHGLVEKDGTLEVPESVAEELVKGGLFKLEVKASRRKPVEAPNDSDSE